MEFMNGCLSILMHLVILVFLVFYLPISYLWRLVLFVFVKPFTMEDMKDKVVLITGASSGIGEVNYFNNFHHFLSHTFVKFSMHICFLLFFPPSLFSLFLFSF